MFALTCQTTATSHRELKVRDDLNNKTFDFDRLMAEISAAAEGKDLDGYVTAARVVVQERMYELGKGQKRSSWTAWLREMAVRHCGCDGIRGLDPAVKLDVDMNALDRVTFCLAVVSHSRRMKTSARQNPVPKLQASTS